jgi:hypothetical protein
VPFVLENIFFSRAETPRRREGIKTGTREEEITITITIKRRRERRRGNFHHGGTETRRNTDTERSRGKGNDDRHNIVAKPNLSTAELPLGFIRIRGRERGKLQNFPGLRL